MTLGFCPGCNRDVPLKRVRPWPDMGFSIGECVHCESTLKALDLPPVKVPPRHFHEYMEHRP